MGNKRSGRPGGNPDLEPYQFQQQYDWDESCTALLALKVPPNIKEKLTKLPKWQERVRRAIAAELEKNPPQEGDNIN